MLYAIRKHMCAASRVPAWSSKYIGRSYNSIVIAGPTAAGKTSISAALAMKLKTEVVNVDSVQLYKHVDIGSAKPAASLLSAVRHHMVDEAELSESFNAASFAHRARLAVEKLIDMNATPIIAGGSGFYMDAILFGNLPEEDVTDVDEELRELLRATVYEDMDWEDAADIVAELEPEYASGIARNDRYRIVRTLEKLCLSLDGKLPARESRDPLQFRGIYVTMPRVALCRVIDYRCEEMFHQGLLEEVLALKFGQDLDKNSACSRAIGYKECLEYFDGIRYNPRKVTVSDLKKLLFEFQNSSRQLSRRQGTWYRKQDQFLWMPMLLGGGKDDIEQLSVMNPRYRKWQTRLHQQRKQTTDSILKVLQMPDEEWKAMLEERTKERMTESDPLSVFDNSHKEVMRTYQPILYLLKSESAWAELAKRIRSTLAKYV